MLAPSINGIPSVDAENSYLLEANALEAEAIRYLDPQTFEDLADRLASLPDALVAQRPRLLRLRAHLERADRNDHGALGTLELACQLAVRQQDWAAAARCALDQSRWYQHKEDFEAARAALSQAERYVELSRSDDPLLEAELSMAIAWLWPDLGRNDLAATWSTRALHRFEAAGSLPGQVEALWVLSVVHTYQARLLDAIALLERALRLHELAGAGPLRRLFLLNVRAHIALYAGDIDTGLRIVREETAPLVELLPNSKPALYLAMAETALLCHRMEWPGALAALDRAEAVASASSDDGFLPWIAMERGWVKLMTGAPVGAVRRELIDSIDPQNQATWRRFTTEMAILDILEGRMSDAERRLKSTLDQYRLAEELLADFSVHVYLAFVLLRKGAMAACWSEIDQAFSWAEAMAIDGFPHLWHPGIVAEVCLEALRRSIHPQWAEIVIVRRLGDVAVPGLMRLASDPREAVSQRARSVLDALDTNRWLPLLGRHAEPAIRDALIRHLALGNLSLSKLGELAARLGDSDRPNWQRLAVFGHYAATDYSRREIAEDLVLSESAVKKHIATIRHTFGVDGAGGRDTGRFQVQEAARTERFVLQGVALRSPAPSTRLSLS